MTDIVERLRDWQDYEPAKQFCPEMVKDALEAADEIERLRAALEAIEGICADEIEARNLSVGSEMHTLLAIPMRIAHSALAAETVAVCRVWGEP